MTRRSVRLVADEAWNLVEGAHTGILTTLRKDGGPVTLPTWFITHEREIYIRTPGMAKKVARIRHDPRVSFLVEAGKRWADLAAVHYTGTAAVVEPPRELGEVLLALLDAKYGSYRIKRPEMPAETRAAYERLTDKVLIRITPNEHFVAWDNSKLGISDPKEGDE